MGKEIRAGRWRVDVTADNVITIEGREWLKIASRALALDIAMSLNIQHGFFPEKWIREMCCRSRPVHERECRDSGNTYQDKDGVVRCGICRKAFLGSEDSIAWRLGMLRTPPLPIEEMPPMVTSNGWEPEHDVAARVLWEEA